MIGPEIQARVEAVKQRVVLSALIGRAVKLARRGREHVGLCPFHQEATPSFTVADDKGFYHCFGCGAHGDAIRFAMEHDGRSFREALEALEQDAGLEAASAVARRESVREEARGGQLVQPFRAAAWVWQQAGPARGELPEEWLRARGIDPDSNGLLDVARYLADCPAQLWNRIDGPMRVRRRAEAMIAPILRVSGGPGERAFSMIGVHITFLSPDGRGKARFAPWRDRRTGRMITPPSRVMWGGSSGGAVAIPARPIASLPGGGRNDSGALKEALARQIDCAGPGPLAVGEGIESTCSLLEMHPDCRMGFATLSLRNLQGSEARNGPHDSVQLWNVAGDPQVEMFTLEQPGRVLVGVDSDMKPLKDRWVQERPKAPAVKRDISGRERADLCGALAAWHWRRAGAERVQVVRPPMGQDFNDMARAVAGRRAA